jgi:hypothetical protein
MKPLYNINGLVHWTQSEIHARERMQAQFAEGVFHWLRGENAAWRFDRVEAPIMYATCHGTISETLAFASAQDLVNSLLKECQDPQS